MMRSKQQVGWFAAYVGLYVTCVFGHVVWLVVGVCAVAAIVIAHTPSWRVLLSLVAVPVCDVLIYGQPLRVVAVVVFVLVPAWLIGRACARQRPVHETMLSAVAVLVIGQASWLIGKGAVGALLAREARRVVDALFQPLAFVYDVQMVHKYAAIVVEMSQTRLPALMVFIAVAYVVFVHVCMRLARPWMHVPVPKLSPVVSWQMPRAFVWVFVCVVVLEVFVSEFPRAIWEWAVVNAMLLCLAAFAIQGVAFLAYVGDVWRIRVLPWIVLIGFVFSPTPLAVVVLSMLGVIDTTFAVRDMMTRTHKK